MKALVLAIVLAGCAGCPPTPQPTPVADAAPAPPSSTATPETACATMQRLGCVVKPDCAAAFRAINADPAHFRPVDVVCLTGAVSVNDVRRCGASCGPDGG